MEKTAQPLKRRRSKDPPRIVVSLDLDCFYASVAIRERPHLHDKPVGIFQKNVLATCSYVARARGVPKMGRVAEAQKICPDIVLIDGSDLTPFRAASAEVITAVRTWLADRVAMHAGGKGVFIPCEKLGMDEVFIELTALVELEKSAPVENWKLAGHAEGTSEDPETVRSLTIASRLVHKLREDVTGKTKLNMCAGVSENKVLAKLAGNIHKPNDQTVLFKDSAPAYVAALPPRKLMGIGSALGGKLKEWAEQSRVDITTVSNLLAYFQAAGRMQELSSILGSDAAAKKVLRLCRGEDDSPVTNSGPPKMMSCETALRSIDSMEKVRHILGDRASALLRRLNEDFLEWGYRQPKTFTLKIRFSGQGFRCLARSASLPFNAITRAVCGGKEVAVRQAHDVLMHLALAIIKTQGDVAADKKFSLSLLGMGLSNFSPLPPKMGGKSMACFLRPVGVPVDGDSSQRVPPPGAEDAGVTAEAPTNVPRCPICNCVLPSQPHLQNAHIDACISSPKRPEPAEVGSQVVQPLSAEKKLRPPSEPTPQPVPDTATPPAKKKSRPPAEDVPEPVPDEKRPSCPICQRPLPLSAFFQNAHIDACVSSDAPSKIPTPRKKRKQGVRSITSFFKKK